MTEHDPIWFCLLHELGGGGFVGGIDLECAIALVAPNPADTRGGGGGDAELPVYRVRGADGQVIVLDEIQPLPPDHVRLAQLFLAPCVTGNCPEMSDRRAGTQTGQLE